MNQLLDNKETYLTYSPRMREYNLALRGKYAVQGIDYCPWCGIKLPSSLRDDFFEILKNELYIEDPVEAQEQGALPQEFTTDQWWKKRGF